MTLHKFGAEAPHRLKYEDGIVLGKKLIDLSRKYEIPPRDIAYALRTSVAVISYLFKGRPVRDKFMANRIIDYLNAIESERSLPELREELRFSEPPQTYLSNYEISLKERIALGVKLGELIQEKNLSMRRVTDFLGISLNAYYRYIQGETSKIMRTSKAESIKEFLAQPEEFFIQFRNSERARFHTRLPDVRRKKDYNLMDRLAALKEVYGLSDKDIGKFIGVSNQAVSLWRGKLCFPNKITEEKVKEFCDLPEEIILKLRTNPGRQLRRNYSTGLKKHRRRRKTYSVPVQYLWNIVLVLLLITTTALFTYQHFVK